MLQHVRKVQAVSCGHYPALVWGSYTMPWKLRLKSFLAPTGNIQFFPSVLFYYPSYSLAACPVTSARNESLLFPLSRRVISQALAGCWSQSSI